MCCANKAIGTLAFLKKRDKGPTHYDFNLFQAHKEKENTCRQSGDVICTAFNYRPLSQWNWNARQSNSIRIHHPVQKKAQNISNTLGYLQSAVCVCIISLSGQNCLRLEIKTVSLPTRRKDREGGGMEWETIYSNVNREEVKNTIERSGDREPDRLSSQQQRQRAVGSFLCSLFTNKLTLHFCLAKKAH